jgi:hypothetical protein
MSAVVEKPSLRASVRGAVWIVTWRMLVGLGAGAIAGVLVGGVGGRLAMLLLRLTSPDAVIGLTSDDGFEIGVVSLQTFNLVAATAMVGGIVGVLYAVVRAAIPARLRVPTWTALWAIVGGAAVVHDDGIDFTLIEPAALAIALFVVLPGAGAAVVALLAERWSDEPPWQRRRLSVVLGVCALAGTFAVVFAFAAGAIVFLVTAAIDRLGPVENPLQKVARVVVPVAMCLIAALAAVDLVRDSARILD